MVVRWEGFGRDVGDGDAGWGRQLNGGWAGEGERKGGAGWGGAGANRGLASSFSARRGRMRRCCGRTS